MALNINVNSDFSMQEASDVIRSALALDERLAKYKKTRYSDICKDLDDYFDWYAAKKGLDHWNKKLNILSGISL